MSQFQKNPREIHALKKSDRVALWVSALVLIVIMIIGYLVT